jgi:anaerobic ribonucleoside-triphosphate reductase activating protein
MRRIHDQGEAIEGVTFSGGEPMVQSSVLIPLAEQIQDAGLTLMVYTGLERGEIKAPSQQKLLELTDILISGPYRESERDLSLLWRGSRNQEVHFLSSAYSPESMDKEGEVEIHLDDDGRIEVTGFPDDELLELLE